MVQENAGLLCYCNAYENSVISCTKTPRAAVASLAHLVHHNERRLFLYNMDIEPAKPKSAENHGRSENGNLFKHFRRSD